MIRSEVEMVIHFRLEVASTDNFVLTCPSVIKPCYLTPCLMCVYCIQI